MKNFSTWMIVLFMVMFWGFRIVAAVGGELNLELAGLSPLNQSVEVLLLFTTLISIILVVKRKMLGGFIYLLTYGLYFGTYVFENLKVILEASEGAVDMNITLSMLIAIIGVILPIACMLDLVFDKSRQLHPTDKKTDCFYKEEKYDRKIDDRADKIYYRTLLFC